MMPFRECLIIAEQHSEIFSGYRVISFAVAVQLLGQERADSLKANRVHGGKPSGYDGFYFWNVATGLFWKHGGATCK